MSNSNLTFDEYQEKAKEFAIFPRSPFPELYLGIGLVGEAGEVLEKIKKVWRDCNGDTDTYRERIFYELGDILWYLAVMADELGYTLADIAQGNTGKLESRRQAGTISGSGDNR